MTSRLRFQLGFEGQAIFSQEGIEYDTIKVGGGDGNRSRFFSNQGIYAGQKVASLRIGIGFEAQKPIRKAFELIYGTDMMVRYFYTDDDVTNLRVNGVRYDYLDANGLEVRNTQIGITPFLGFNYKINDLLHLGLESSFNLFYFQSKISQKNLINYENISETTGLISNFSPVRFINLGVRF